MAENVRVERLVSGFTGLTAGKSGAELDAHVSALLVGDLGDIDNALCRSAIARSRGAIALRRSSANVLRRIAIALSGSAIALSRSASVLRRRSASVLRRIAIALSGSAIALSRSAIALRRRSASVLRRIAIVLGRGVIRLRRIVRLAIAFVVFTSSTVLFAVVVSFGWVGAVGFGSVRVGCGAGGSKIGC